MIVLRNLAILTIAAVLAMAGVAVLASIPLEWVAGTVLIVEITAGATLAGAAILRRAQRQPRPRREYRNDPDNRLPPVRVTAEIVQDIPPARLALPEPQTKEIVA